MAAVKFTRNVGKLLPDYTVSHSISPFP